VYSEPGSANTYDSPVFDDRQQPAPLSPPARRRGRGWVVAALALLAIALGYGIVELSTQSPNEDLIRVEGLDDSQRIFGGVAQQDDRLGSADAPVAIQIFNDLQCRDCRADFLDTVPGLVDDLVRPGDVKLLYRHHSVAKTPLELGFLGAEAAANQGYGWQYTYLFFRNQEEARRNRVDENFLDAIAGGVAELDLDRWNRDFQAASDPDSTIAQRLDSDESLAQDLGIRSRQAAIVSGPRGTVTLQDGPTLGEIERAVRQVQ
jgi:protein-disulfide isomerase